MQEKTDKEMLVATFLITLLIKLVLSFAIPLTSDEALFALWGRFLDFGYYDHPPMIGWIVHLFGYLGRSVFVMRLPAVLSTLLAGLGIYLVLKGRDRGKAAFATILFLASPINILNVIVTTDTPLIVFSFFSCCFLYRALSNGRLYEYLLSGMCLGAAFLSKYFACLLGLSYVVYFLGTCKTRRKTAGFALLFLAVIPFVALNIYWNYTHCWTNIMFNLFNRNRMESFSVVKILAYIVSAAYLITPPVIYYLYKRRKEAWRESMRGSGTGIFAAAFAVPMAVFALLAFKKMVGLHWMLSFFPFMYVVIAFLLSEEELVKSIKFMTFFTLVHLLLVGTALSLPLSLLKHNKNYSTIIMGTRTAEVLSRLQPYEKDYFFATGSYADSSLLSFYSKKYFSVFGGGSQHGRQDDILTDFRVMNGRNILIVKGSRPNPAEYAPYFAGVEIREITVHEATLYLVLGRAFNYSQYRERILRHIKEQYYTIPRFLPMPASSCYFFNKYF